MTNRAIDTSVLIVGAGPVGLTLAMDLASRGIDVTVMETRRAGEPPNVKCNQVSARSMEIFRRLGVAGKIRETGLPPEFRNDVVMLRDGDRTPSLSRISLPSRAGRMRGEKGDDGWWPTAEWPHRINQLHIEPLLFAHAAAQPRIRILNRTQFEEMSQDGDWRDGSRARSRQRRAASPSPAAISWAATAHAPPCARPSAPSFSASRWCSACSRPISVRRR